MEFNVEQHLYVQIEAKLKHQRFWNRINGHVTSNFNHYQENIISQRVSVLKAVTELYIFHNSNLNSHEKTMSKF